MITCSNPMPLVISPDEGRCPGDWILKGVFWGMISNKTTTTNSLYCLVTYILTSFIVRVCISSVDRRVWRCPFKALYSLREKVVPLPTISLHTCQHWSLMQTHNTSHAPPVLFSGRRNISLDVLIFTYHTSLKIMSTLFPTVDSIPHLSNP